MSKMLKSESKTTPDTIVNLKNCNADKIVISFGSPKPEEHPTPTRKLKIVKRNASTREPIQPAMD
jgi:hypothetical protein